jgi:hypothetical protein
MERELPAFVEVSSFTEQKTGSPLVQVNYKCRIEGCKGSKQAKVKVPNGQKNFTELGRWPSRSPKAIRNASRPMPKNS